MIVLCRSLIIPSFSAQFEANRLLIAKMEMAIVAKTQSHRQLFRMNSELKMDIEDLAFKTANW